MSVTLQSLPSGIDRSILPLKERTLLEELWASYLCRQLGDTNEEKNFFVKALVKSFQNHNDKPRKSKESYFSHDLRCALRLMHANADLTMIIIILLHEFIEDDHWTYQELVEEFNQIIARTILAVSKVPRNDYITRLERAQLHIRAIIREVVLNHNYLPAIAKITDRLENTHDTAGLEILEDQEKRKQALEQLFGETRDLFIPMFRWLLPYIPDYYLPYYRGSLFAIERACDNHDLRSQHIA